jgi:hypothetical protein
MPNAQNALMSLHPSEHLPAPATYPPFPEQSSLSLRPSAQVGSPLAPADVNKSLRSTTPPNMHEDWSGPMFPGPPSAIVSGAPSYVSDHYPHPPATASMNWQAERTPPRRPGKGRRAEPPKDPRATNRLLDQRKSDDENIEALCKLFVPPGAEVKWKKDRLGMSELRSHSLSLRKGGE